MGARRDEDEAVNMLLRAGGTSLQPGDLYDARELGRALTKLTRAELRELGGFLFAVLHITDATLTRVIQRLDAERL